MSSRKETISGVARSATIKRVQAPEVPSEQTTVLRPSLIAAAAYNYNAGDLLFLDSIPWIDASANAVSAVLCNIMESVMIDLQRTIRLVVDPEVKRFADVEWKLLHILPMDARYQQRVKSGQESAPSKEMDVPCGNKKCRGTKFWCHASQMRSADEPITTYRVCVACDRIEESW